MGDKAEMEIGERAISKQKTSSATNHGHAKVRVPQKVPDTEQTDEGDANTSCSGGNTNGGVYKNPLFTSLQNPFRSQQSQPEH